MATPAEQFSRSSSPELVALQGETDVNRSNRLPILGKFATKLWKTKFVRRSMIGLAILPVAVPMGHKIADREVKHYAQMGGEVAGEEAGKKAVQTIEERLAEYLKSPQFKSLTNAQLNQLQPEVEHHALDAIYGVEEVYHFDLNGDGSIGEPKPRRHHNAQPTFNHKFVPH